MYGGATCAFELTEGNVFPPGRYCLLLISSTCPQGFHHRSGVVRLGTNIQPLGNLCCRTEESVGAIRFPIKLEAPFKLPAVHRPCQAIENFNVDSELQFCVYYPQGKTPQTLIVWPRVLGRKTPSDVKSPNRNTSMPIHCAITLRRIRRPERSSVDRLMMYFNLIHDQWLTNKRPRWLVDQHEVDDICFNEVHGSSIPATTLSGRGYCLFVFGSCPKRNFEMLGASPYMNSVLCCTVAGNSGVSESNTEPEHDTQPLRSFVTLGHASAKDIQELSGFSGTKVLELDANTTSETCPQFANLVLRRRVVEGHIAPTTMRLENTPDLTRMFNVTHMSYDEFKQRTGIWARENIAYTHYCEYSVRKTPSSSLDIKRDWPVANFALPKPVSGCPNNSETGTFQHRQDEFGFHYSQPIHLDGIYLRGDKRTWLQYCVFTSDGAIQPSAEDYVPAELPPGHYCVLRVRSECPSGFTEGVLSIIEGPQKSHPRIPGHLRDAILDSIPQHTPVFDITRTRLSSKDPAITVHRLDYHFCCRADSPGVDIPIQGFPTEAGAFFLYRVGDQCQQIEGMRVTEEYICMDAPNRGDSSWTSIDRNQSSLPYSVKGLTPTRIPLHSQCDVEINLCYYEKDIPHSEPDAVNVHNTGEWPVGAYALPNAHRSDTENACPPGFTQNHMSLVSVQTMFYELEIIPTVIGSYFLEIIGHNQSALNVHYCDRDRPSSSQDKNTTLPPPVSAEQLALQWPKGDYCVISTDLSNHCPPGLNRHSRSVAELCCRTDKVQDPVPVEWPFTGDFFLFGGDRCLPIKNTHVERYPVRLLATNYRTMEAEWDVLCHYMPIEWTTTENKWPSGDYMLPIGRRSGLKSSMVYLAEYVDDVTHKHINSNPNQTPDSEGSASRYKCPETFQRARFTFVSKNSETRQVPSGDGGESQRLNVVAMTAMEFCIRENDTVRIESGEDEWPNGDYCVFTMNAECPTGMRATREAPMKIPNFLLKSVDILDEYGNKMSNKQWHEDADNHVVYFMRCCREDHTLLLRLPPSSDGFYLARSSPLCSIVPGTLLDQEQVATYLSPPIYEKRSQNLNDRDLTLYREFFTLREGLMYLCYYHPGTGLDYSVAIPPEMQHYSTVNLTEKDMEDMARLCGCAQNAVCIPHRRAECFCKPGYYGDGRHTCRAITPLTDGCANLCDNEAICVERLEPIFHKKKRVTSHYCVCREGYVGDGFTCHPSCTDRDCRPFSRCVHNVIQKTTKCECLEGTIESVGRCNLDIYRSVQHEKDLPQFLVHHDHCLSKATQLALRELTPSRYFYVFVPDEMLRTCHNITTHIVVRKTALTESELNSATAESPVVLVTENNTVIEIYPENGTWVIDGHLAQTPPVRFVNGEMYAISAPLKLTPYVRSNSGYYAAVVIVSLFLVAGLALLVYKLYPHRHSLRMPFITSHGRVLPRRTFWRQQGESVLVEEPDCDD
ncbi:nidogen-2 [Clonorchis sinensis]|uniref:Nidogen-2 n=1 Tax=Clonorchis sinensis TaxID=79923 RepID=G7YHN9_CLOSI|nr:nidogen-2 [Clonorchis sinensis]